MTVQCYFTGDFHFLWECLHVIFLIFRGTPSQVGSLCNMRECVRRLRVDKSVKVFNTCDEFLVHMFKAHLTASVCTQLKLKDTSDTIEHEPTLQWLLANLAADFPRHISYIVTHNRTVNTEGKPGRGKPFGKECNQ